jgi:hypothetical protein
LDVKLSQLPGADVVDEAMHLQVTLCDSVNYGRILQQHLDTAPDVKLNQLQSSLFLVQALKQNQILSSQSPQGHQPRVDETKPFVIEGGSDTTAGSMAADDDMLDLQILDCVLDDRKRVDIRWDDNVGDVAMAKDLSRLQAQDGCLGTSGVGAADPEDLRSLSFS